MKSITIGLMAMLMSMPLVVSAQQSYVVTVTANGVSFNMMRVGGGTFTMGATEEQGDDPWDYEGPTHKVTLSTFYIGETEVTQELWNAVMGRNPSNFAPNVIGSECGYDDFVSAANRLNRKYPGSVKIPTKEEFNALMTVGGSMQRPVEGVNVADCQEFIEKLNKLTGKKFRLPTEAEWEYAARGGKQSHNYKYSGSNNVDAVAWYRNNAQRVGNASPDYGPHAVGSKESNELGIYDMSGNVAEWTLDGWGNYSEEAQTNPQAPASNDGTVVRGGRWNSHHGEARVSARSTENPKLRSESIGLRLVLVE